MIFLISISLSGILLLIYLVVYIPKFEYIRDRILSFLIKKLELIIFSPDKALDSITSGGFFGKGIGEGTLKNRVPEARIQIT